MNINTFVTEDWEIARQKNDPFFWIVKLVNGGDPEMGGVVMEMELVTKKWERVEDLISSWQHLIDEGTCHAVVLQMAFVEEMTFSIDES